MADRMPLLYLRPALVLVVLLLGLVACSAGPDTERLQGRAFGTGWSLIYQVDEGVLAREVIEDGILEAFETVNQSMNTYDPESAISRFNALPVTSPWRWTGILPMSSMRPVTLRADRWGLRCHGLPLG